MVFFTKKCRLNKDETNLSTLSTALIIITKYKKIK